MNDRINQLEANQKIEEPNEDIPKTAPTDFRAFWKGGLNFATQDGSFKLRLGGRIHNDWLWISEDSNLKTDVGEQEDGTEFRRARLYLSGLIYDNVEFKAEYDFAGGDADFKDVYIALLDFPLGKIRAGHFKEPFSLEELTSSNRITFLERALPNALAPGRNAGVMLYGTALAASDPRMTWAVGVFRDTPDDGDGRDDGGYNFTGRLTWLPWYKEGGTSIVHLGTGYSYRNPNDHTASFDSRPEAHLADNFLDTGAFTSDDVELVGFEAACLSGPLSIQGEYILADADVASSANFHGYYAQVSYILTGEHRRYKASEGTFAGVKPKENFRYGAGPGAWEVAFRYSGLDLDDNIISGSKLHDTTAGLNWYLNPNMRIMWNYVHADKEYVGDADMLMLRLQVDF
ncbi:MAG: hypothetical protein JXM79_19455 [Sedimentisphaerales bacterium]|nr:hypothetical protein [Sedimentisphaerales bacterium]